MTKKKIDYLSSERQNSHQHLIYIENTTPFAQVIWQPQKNKINHPQGRYRQALQGKQHMESTDKHNILSVFQLRLGSLYFQWNYIGERQP